MGLPLAERQLHTNFANCRGIIHFVTKNMTKGKYPQQDKVQGIYNFVEIQNNQANFCAKTTLLTHGRS